MYIEERPWGKFSNLQEEYGYKVKCIEVNPGSKLSLQKHHHRSEHWIVVQGVALVEIDGVKLTLNENENVYIPVGSIHRLSNPEERLLKVIEVQMGSYLGEDDIVRFEDNYGREVV